MNMKYDSMADIGQASQTEVHRVYFKMLDIAVRIAQYIGGFGYSAWAHPNAGELAHVPMAYLAGLGELGKHGSLINPEFGSSWRLALVSTDMPLVVDGPKDYGIDAMCDRCTVCTRFCPGEALSPEKQEVNGVFRWHVDTAKCEPYFNRLWGCKICLMVCPFNGKGAFKAGYKGIAKELAQAGFNIVLNGSSDKGACERVADEVRTIGTDAIIAMADIGDQSAVNEMVETALQAFGRIDALINNAAIRPASAFLDMSDDDLARVMNVNCYAAVWLSRAFLPGMVDNGWGRIINFSGMNSLQGYAGRSHVSISKHASWGLTKSLLREFGPKGVTANMISPGTIPDEDEDIAQSSRFQALLEKNPVGRLGTTEDIAAMVGYLCSEKGGFINGQLLQVNGGVVG